MTILFQLISGTMLGFEFVEDEELEITWLVVDLLIVRVMITKLSH